MKQFLLSISLLVASIALTGATGLRRKAKVLAPADLANCISALTANQKPVVGKPGAQTVVVGFVDYQCPSCRANFRKVWARVANDSNAAFYVEQMPLPNHPLATPAAEVALEAVQAGKFNEVHQALMGGDHLSQVSINQVVATFGLRKAPSKQVVDELKREKKAFLNSGLNYVPVFVSKIGGQARAYGWKDALISVQ